MTRLKTDLAYSDTILLNLAQEELDAMVSDALKMYRDGDVLALSTSQLAQSSLLECGYLSGEQVSADERGRLTQSLLRWAVERIRPSGEHSWLLSTWRSYNILHHFYTRGMRASELAEKMAIAEQTLYQSRPQAISTLSRLLRAEISEPSDEHGRRNYALADRYARHNSLEQRLLRSICVFPHSIPTALLHKLASQTGKEKPTLGNIQISIHHLVTSNMLLSNEQGTELVLQPQMRHFVLTLLLPDERKHLHCAASEHYLQQQMFLDAARHLRIANEYQDAAQLIIDHQRDIVDSLQIEELTELVSLFTQQELSSELWPRLKIVAGEIAEFNKDIDAAVEEYRQALSAFTKETKALAYYRRAKAFEHKNMDESLAHYDYAIRLLEELNCDAVRRSDVWKIKKVTPLLVRTYIDQSWIFLQQRPNLARAENGLHKAREKIDEGDRATWSDLHNALGVFHLKQNNPVQTEEHYWQAWLAANEIQDIERMTNTSHNLGNHLSAGGKHEQALEYLNKSRALCIETSNRQMEAFCDMSMGICYFYLHQQEKAVQYYGKAAEIAAELGNQSILIRAYCNLAETYAELGYETEMHRYYSEGLRLATELGDEGAKNEFAAVVIAYPRLALRPQKFELNERQQQALDHVKQQGRITNREYQEIAGVSQKQAVRDLNDLIDKDLLTRIGQGRSTRYTLPTTKVSARPSYNGQEPKLV